MSSDDADRELDTAAKGRMARLPRGLRRAISTVGTLVALAGAGAFTVLWFSSTERLSFLDEVAPVDAGKGALLTFDVPPAVPCLPAPDTVYTPTSFGRWQQSHRLVDGEWLEDVRQFWHGTPSRSDTLLCASGRTVEVLLPESLTGRAALCDDTKNCVELNID